MSEPLILLCEPIPASPVAFNRLTDPAILDGIAAGVCRLPPSPTTMRPWAPLMVPPPPLKGRTLDIMLACGVALNVDYLIEHPDTPPIYEAGVRYQREIPGEEQWLTIPWILMRGYGDCEDLGMWRAAELQVRLHEPAQCIYIHQQLPDGTNQYHIRVLRGKRGPGGQPLVEDPSVALGMNAYGAGASSYVEQRTAQKPHAQGSWFETFITDGTKNSNAAKGAK